jgi:DNA-binding NtrC family response regulator
MSSSDVKNAWLISDRSVEPSSHFVLVVDTRLASLRRTADTLRRAGYAVVEAASFEDAKRILGAKRPWLVISGLRLAAFNGLHLVHLGRLTQPDLNAVIISAGADNVLEAEAERVGASLLIEPVPPHALLSLIENMWRESSAHVLVGTDRRQAERRRLHTLNFAPERRLQERRLGSPDEDEAGRTLA